MMGPVTMGWYSDSVKSNWSIAAMNVTMKTRAICTKLNSIVAPPFLG